MRSRIRVPWESEWRYVWKSKSWSLRSWCKSPPIQSPSLPFHSGNLKSPMKVEERRLGWLEDEKPNLAEGVPAVFIIPLIRIPDTFGICGMAVLFPNFIHLIPIPFSIISWSKIGMSLILLRWNYFSYPNAMSITSLFQIFGIYRFWLLEREIVRHSRLWT